MIVFNIVFTLFIPVLMILCGYLMYKHTPKDINGLVGYRTAMSMKNQETWDFAHNYCGRLWVKVGAVMTIISALVCVPYFFMSSGKATVIMCIAEVIQVVVLCWLSFYLDSAPAPTIVVLFIDSTNRTSTQR